MLKGSFGVADGDPLLFGAQVFSAGEVEGGECAGFRRGQRRVGLVVAVEVFFDAQGPVSLVIVSCLTPNCI